MVGFSGLALLVIGLVLLWVNGGNDTSVSGILVRIGVMLVVVWVGFPSLTKPDGKQSLVWFLGLFGGLFLVAFRPRLFFAVFLVTAFALAVNWVWKNLGHGIGRPH